MNRLLWHWDGRLVISYGEVMAGYAYIKGMAGFRNYGAAGIHWGHPCYICGQVHRRTSPGDPLPFVYLSITKYPI